MYYANKKKLIEGIGAGEGKRTWVLASVVLHLYTYVMAHG